MTTDPAQQRPAAAPVPATWRPIATVAVCAIGGPLLGMVLLFAMLGAVSAFTTGHADPLGMPLIALHPIAWMFAFAMAGVPALLSAVAYVALDRLVPPNVPRTPMAACVGAASMIMLLAWVGGLNNGDPKSGVSIVVASAITASVLAHLTRRWRYGQLH